MLFLKFNLNWGEGAAKREGAAKTLLSRYSQVFGRCSVLRCATVCCGCECCSFMQSLRITSVTRTFRVSTRWICCVLICTLSDTATRCSTLQHAATRCNTLQHAATRCNTTPHNVDLLCANMRTTTHQTTLQHIATHKAHHSTPPRLALY